MLGHKNFNYKGSIMEDFQDAPKFKDWIKTLKTNGCKIDALEEKGLIHRINGELLFA